MSNQRRCEVLILSFGCSLVVAPTLWLIPHPHALNALYGGLLGGWQLVNWIVLRQVIRHSRNIRRERLKLRMVNLNVCEQCVLDTVRARILQGDKTVDVDDLRLAITFATNFTGQDLTTAVERLVNRGLLIKEAFHIWLPNGVKP